MSAPSFVLLVPSAAVRPIGVLGIQVPRADAVAWHALLRTLRALQRAQPLASGITVRAHAAWHWMSPHAFRGHAGVVRALWEERALVVDPAVVAPLVASARDFSVDLMVWEGGVLLTPTGDMPGSFVSVPEDVVAAMTYSNWVALGVPSSRPALGVA